MEGDFDRCAVAMEMGMGMGIETEVGYGPWATAERPNVWPVGPCCPVSARSSIPSKVTEVGRPLRVIFFNFNKNQHLLDVVTALP